MCPSSKGPVTNKINGSYSNSGTTKTMEEIKQFIIEKVPDMKDELEVLEYKDLIEVYHDFVEKDN